MYTSGSGDFGCGSFHFGISPKPAYIPKCGTTISKVSQHTFDSGDTVFKSFCSNWKQDKKSTSTIYTGGGHVNLYYEPDNGGKNKCTMSCNDAYYSLAIGCAEGDGNGKPPPITISSITTHNLTKF